jgi:hypothetical protein
MFYSPDPHHTTSGLINPVLECWRTKALLNGQWILKLCHKFWLDVLVKRGINDEYCSSDLKIVNGWIGDDEVTCPVTVIVSLITLLHHFTHVFISYHIWLYCT